MSGNLMKHEILSAGRMMAVIYGIFAGATALVCILLFWMRHAGEGVADVFSAVPFMLYIATLVILVIVSFIYLCHRFYQTMYSEQGYLTHTLPVKTATILNVKILISFGFLVLTGIVCVTSLMVTGAVASGKGMGFVTQIIGQVFYETAAELHVSKAAVYSFAALEILLGCLYSLLLFFAGSSIGQLAHRSKGGAGIAAGIGLYYLNQIVSLIIIAVYYFLFREAVFGNEAQWMAVMALGLPVFWIIVYYMISRKVVQKHLNLG